MHRFCHLNDLYGQALLAFIAGCAETNAVKVLYLFSLSVLSDF